VYYTCLPVFFHISVKRICLAAELLIYVWLKHLSTIPTPHTPPVIKWPVPNYHKALAHVNMFHLYGIRPSGYRSKNGAKSSICWKTLCLFHIRGRNSCTCNMIEIYKHKASKWYGLLTTELIHSQCSGYAFSCVVNQLGIPVFW